MYIVCIMSFIWRTGTTDDADRGPMTPKEALTFRILLTVVLSLGLLYFVLIASTLRKYGEMMDQAWHRRIIGWVNGTVASATSSPGGIIPRTPTLIKTEAPFSTPPPLRSGFAPTSNLYSTDRRYPRTNYGNTRSRSVSPAGSYIRHGPNRSLQSVGPYDESSIPNLGCRHIHDAGKTDRPVIISRSKPPSRDEDLNRELRSPPGDMRPPSPTLLSLPAPSPGSLPLLHSSEEIPVGDVDHKVEVNSNKSQELIKLTKFLSLAFGDDIRPDVPPSEDELKTWHMTKELWQELQTVSITTL